MIRFIFRLVVCIEIKRRRKLRIPPVTIKVQLKLLNIILHQCTTILKNLKERLKIQKCQDKIPQSDKNVK